MKLSFNQYGDIITATDGKSLELSKPYEAELNRLNMFFNTKKGWYLYNTLFGIDSDYIFGKLYVEDLDLYLFNKKIKEALASSNLLTGAKVSIEQEDAQTLSIIISYNSEDTLWKFYTYKGRLVKIEQEIECNNSYIITVGYLRGGINTLYDLSFLYKRCMYDNSIPLEADIKYKHAIYEVDSKQDQTGIAITKYTLNDLDQQLLLNSPVSSDKWIRVELWPSTKNKVEATTNPYLLRK